MHITWSLLSSSPSPLPPIQSYPVFIRLSSFHHNPEVLRWWPQTWPGRQEQGELATPGNQKPCVSSSQGYEKLWKCQVQSTTAVLGKCRPRTSHGTSDVLERWTADATSQLEQRHNTPPLIFKPVQTIVPGERTEQDAQELKLPEKNCRDERSWITSNWIEGLRMTLVDS